MGIMIYRQEAAGVVIAFNYFVLMIIIFFFIKTRRSIYLVKHNRISKYLIRITKEIHFPNYSSTEGEKVINELLLYQNDTLIILAPFPILICTVVILIKCISYEYIIKSDVNVWIDFVTKNMFYVLFSVINSMLSIFIFLINKHSIDRLMLIVKLRNSSKDKY